MFRITLEEPLPLTPSFKAAPTTCKLSDCKVWERAQVNLHQGLHDKIQVFCIRCPCIPRSKG